MAASPHVLINDVTAPGPDINPDNTGNPSYPSGANVTPGHTISIRLASADSVGQWTLRVVGTDEQTIIPALAGVDPITGIVSTPSTVVTFAVPPGVAGRAYIFQSMVNNGGPAYTTTFGVYTLTGDLFRVAAGKWLPLLRRMGSLKSHVCDQSRWRWTPSSTNCQWS